jgi:uncharacterized protein (DUF488 family)
VDAAAEAGSIALTAFDRRGDGRLTTLYTIGFTGKSAERFFSLLRDNGVNLLVDIRLRPDGQLAGFAKRNDLAYFLRELAACDYLHLPILAPSAEVLDGYRADKNWAGYVERFETLLDERDVPAALDASIFRDHRACLLCSEHKPSECHRSLVAERLARVYGDLTVTHLQ